MDKDICGEKKRGIIRERVYIVMTAIGIEYEKKESGENIEIKEANRSASKLGLEVSISQQSSGGGLSIQLYPLDETFNKIERWKQLSETNPKIPFPEEAFNSQDWYEVSKELREIENEFGSEVTDIIHTTAE